MVAALLNFLSPFLVLLLVNFIEEAEPGDSLTWQSVRPGVMLSVALIATQVIS